MIRLILPVFLAVVCAVNVAAQETTQSTDNPARISAESFLETPFVRFFRQGQYVLALNAMESLLDDYPVDPLLLRYKAVTLSHMGKHEESLALFDELLQRDPNQAPVLFFMAQAYLRSGKASKAIELWQSLADESQEPLYREWSEEMLANLNEVEDPYLAVTKKVSVYGDLGWAYDSNVPLASNDIAVSGVVPDENANRYSANLNVSWRAMQDPKQSVDMISTTRTSLHDDGLDEFNYTAQELSLDWTRKLSADVMPMTVSVRYTGAGTFLSEDIFSVSNRVRFKLDAWSAKQFRTSVSSYVGYSNYAQDGGSPAQTSRDGLYYDVSLAQYYYDRTYTKYGYAGLGYRLAETRGANFVRRGVVARTGFHTPLFLLEDTTLDVNGSFELAEYPRFVSRSNIDTTRRRDKLWRVNTAVTRRLTSQLRTRVFYDYTLGDNNNKLFDYDRHIAGLKVLYSY